jgi:catecholate siderophore receptor
MTQSRIPGTLRVIAVFNPDNAGPSNCFGRKISALGGLMAVSASHAALAVLAGATAAHAQTAAATTPSRAESQLPPIEITSPEPQSRANSAAAQRADRGAQRRRSQAARQPQPTSAPKAFAVSQDARTGTVGYYADSTSSATRTNTPLINVPQSASVLTRDFIADQSTHSITDLSRYVPGVAVHQGEGNRDELVIRGVDTSANFFVNGFRDDV